LLVSFNLIPDKTVAYDAGAGGGAAAGVNLQAVTPAPADVDAATAAAAAAAADGGATAGGDKAKQTAAGGGDATTAGTATATAKRGETTAASAATGGDKSATAASATKREGSGDDAAKAAKAATAAAAAAADTPPMLANVVVTVERVADLPRVGRGRSKANEKGKSGKMPHPFAELSIGGVVKRTVTMQRTCAPHYNESFMFRGVQIGGAGEQLSLKCFHRPLLGKPRLLGAANVPMAPLLATTPPASRPQQQQQQQKEGGIRGAAKRHTPKKRADVHETRRTIPLYNVDAEGNVVVADNGSSVGNAVLKVAIQRVTSN
jgi:hypothetical protein